MNIKQWEAYEWSKSAQLKSAVADKVRELSGLITSLLEENQKLRDLCGERQSLCRRLLRERDNCRHLGANADGKEQGRLVLLPCKVGDTVWFKPDTCNPRKMRVQGISLSASCTDAIIHFGGYPVLNVWGSEFGKTVFLTREEAEAALKGGAK